MITKAKNSVEELFAPRRLNLPKHVLGIRTREEFDSEGEPALGVWVILSDSTTTAQRHPRELAKITERIRSVGKEYGELPLPFVRFRLQSEQDLLDGIHA